jgi:quercetin dioxygenase-like cupin family protein
MRIRDVWTHAAAAAAGIAATLAVMSGGLMFGGLTFDGHGLSAQAQTAPPGQRGTDLFKVVMADVLGREMRIRVTDRDPGNGGAPHRHPCCHTFGYVLEGTYEFKVDDQPVRQLKAGEVFYEPPNALHAISRNPSQTEKVKYLVIQVADPGKAAIVNE